MTPACHFVVASLLLALLAAHSSTVLKSGGKNEKNNDEREEGEVEEWLSSNGLSQHSEIFRKRHIRDLFQCSRVEGLPDLGDQANQKKMEMAARKLQALLVLRQWLHKNGWQHLSTPLENLGISSLGKLHELDADREFKMEPELHKEILEAKDYLPDTKEALLRLEQLVWVQLQDSSSTTSTPGSESNSLLFRFISCVVAAVLAWMAWELGLTPSEVLWGAPLHKSFTRLEWPEDMTASNTKTLKVIFYTIQGQPLDVSGHLGQLSVEAWHQQQGAPVNAFVAQGTDSNIVDLVFTARLAGSYYISLKCSNQVPQQQRQLQSEQQPQLFRVVRGFPAHAAVEEGEVDAASTILVGARSSTLVLTTTVPETIQIEPRDAFGNPVRKDRLVGMAGRFSMKLLQKLGDSSASSVQGAANFVVYHTAAAEVLSASLAFNFGQEGWYKAVIMLDGVTPIGSSGSNSGDQHLTLIVLSREERSRVNKLIADHDMVHSFEAELVAENGALLGKPKTVSCSLTTKQLTIKEYFLRIFPRRLYTFRLIPATKVTLVRYSGFHRHPVLLFEDSFQGQPQLLMREGNIMAAAFHLIVLNKIGGSESFRDKQSFFNARLLKHHQIKGHKHTRLAVKIDRSDMVGSSFKATRWFGEADWARLLEIEFEGEQGMDQGGLRREWFEILAKKLFHPSFGLFVLVEDNSAAVYPNPNYSSDKSKLYRFAGRIVGKCLYESAHGLTYRQHLPARLAKSFLVQLVGLRVHYRHFADDAPELYSSKIRFIEKNTVEGLELTFADEEFGKDGELIRNVDLKPGGGKISVTDANKIEYLDLLAQHRLAARVREPMESFLTGLHQFVPEQLLSLFDESELELLLCGVREYDLAELKRHHIVIRAGGLSSRTLDWFWLTLSSFSPEQFARLLQFTTGSSQLPPGGFSELKPPFQIASSITAGNLPTAHTCFNMICLPEHGTFRHFEKALLTAINEGNEGFGFA